MKPTLARHSYLEATIAAAASRVPAVILAAILLGITAFPTRADCNPADRIDARCYADLQSATAAAIAANVPLWLPAGTYTARPGARHRLCAAGRHRLSDHLGRRDHRRDRHRPARDHDRMQRRHTGQLEELLLLPHPGHIVRQRRYLASRRPFRPQRLLGRAQFGKDRPPDRQQRRIGIRGSAQLRPERRHLRRRGNGRVGRARDGSGAVLEDLGCRVGDDRDRNADPKWLHILEYDLGDRPRGRPDLPGDHLAVGQSTTPSSRPISSARLRSPHRAAHPTCCSTRSTAAAPRRLLRDRKPAS